MSAVTAAKRTERRPWLMCKQRETAVTNFIAVREGNDGPAVAYVADEKDARLIAAAPDLLAALKKAAHVFRRCELDPVDNSYASILEQAEMAIAKAEGDRPPRAGGPA